MKFLALGQNLKQALIGLVSKLNDDENHTAIIGSEDEALVVMKWERYQELMEAANKPAELKEVSYPYPYPYPVPYYPIKWRDYWPYWSTYGPTGTYVYTGPTLVTGTSTVSPDISVGKSISSSKWTYNVSEPYNDYVVCSSGVNDDGSSFDLKIDPAKTASASSSVSWMNNPKFDSSKTTCTPIVRVSDIFPTKGAKWVD